MKYKKPIKWIWDAIHYIESNGLDQSKAIWVAVNDIKIGVTELEKAVKQEIKNGKHST